MDNFGKRLKEIRAEIKMTQKEFADHVDCTAATISAYENGSKRPSLEIVRTIAERCSVSLDWLCGLKSKEAFKCEITTYSDLFCTILKLQERYPHLFELTTETDLAFGVEDKYSCLKFTDIKAWEFLKEFEKMQQLLKSEIIDIEIYDLWVEKTLKKYNASIDKENMIPKVNFMY